MNMELIKMKIFKNISSGSKKLIFSILKTGIFLVLILQMLITLRKVQEKRSLIPSNIDSFYLPSGKSLHIMSVGYDRMLADLIWIKTLMYFGEEMVGLKRQTWLYSFVDTITDLDPHFEKSYEWGGAAIMYGGALIDNKAVSRSNKIYEKGLKRFPNNWRLAVSLGFNLVYEYDFKDEKINSKNRIRAVKLFMKAAKSPEAPSYVKSFALSTMDREGLRVMAIEFVKEAYATAKTEDERNLLEQKLKKLLGQKNAEKWNLWKEQFYIDYQANLPYASETLFIIMGNHPDKKPKKKPLQDLKD
jgi:hypothetical protein